MFSGVYWNQLVWLSVSVQNADNFVLQTTIVLRFAAVIMY